MKNLPLAHCSFLEALEAIILQFTRYVVCKKCQACVNKKLLKAQTRIMIKLFFQLFLNSFASASVYHFSQTDFVVYSAALTVYVQFPFLFHLHSQECCHINENNFSKNIQVKLRWMMMDLKSGQCCYPRKYNSCKTTARFRLNTNHHIYHVTTQIRFDYLSASFYIL